MCRVTGIADADADADARKQEQLWLTCVASTGILGSLSCKYRA